MIHVEEVNDIYQLVGYRTVWNALLPKTRGATFFQSFDWLETYWKHFGGGQKLRVLVVCDQRRPIGILPLVVRTESSRVGGLRVLTYPLHDWGTFYGPIGPDPTVTLTAGLKHVRNTKRDYDLLDLRWVDLDGCDHGRTEAAMRRAKFAPRKQAWNQAAVVEMTGTWDDYWKSRKKKLRQNVGRLRRRLAERGNVSLMRYRPKGTAHGDGDPRWDLFDACMKIARHSWQGSSTDGTTLCHPDVCDYLRDTHAIAARVGCLDLTLLLLDGQPLAFIYHYHYQGRVYGLRKGFDPQFASSRPGLVLQAMVLEDSFERGDCFYDMGVGSLDIKRYWKTSIRTSYRYTHFPMTVSRVQLLRLKRWFLERVYGDAYVACAQTA